MTCGEFKKWLSQQPDDKPLHFAYTAIDGEMTRLEVAEAWPSERAYCVEFEAAEGGHA